MKTEKILFVCFVVGTVFWLRPTAALGGKMKTGKNELAPRTVQLHVYARYRQRTLYARVTVIGEAYVADGATMELELVRERTGEVVGTRRIPDLLRAGRKEVTFSVGRVEAGTCSFRAVLIDRHGTRMPVRVLQEKSRGNVPWLGCDTGVTREVPAPWTPMRSRRTRGGAGLLVSCWGRTYEFDELHFIKRIVTKEKPVLAAPMRLLATVNGRNVRWRNGTLKPVAQEDGEVVFTRNFSSGPLRVNALTRVDFDGMVRVDWSLAASKPVKLDSLVMEITIPAEHAKYLYHFPGSWGSAKNVGSLPAQDVRLPFRPFIWLGDEERGLAWFAESDLNWYKDDPDRVTEITRKDDLVTLRLRLVSKPVLLVPAGGADVEMTGFGQETVLAATVGELRYTFGLHATPVKPVEKDAWERRIVCITQNTEGFRPRLRVADSLLDRLKDAGVRTVVIFEHWADAEGYTATPHAEQLKKIVRACHDRGLKVLLYFSFLISDIAPEWRDFGKDSVIIPKGGYPVMHCLPQPEQSAWRVCLRSAWQDRLVSGIAEAMKEFDADGVYLDGTEYPFGCCNTEHGCGALRPDGAIAPTYPIFSTRSAMRRIYNVVRSHRPDGQLNVHNSTCMTIPTLGWGTTYWDGEQFGQLGAMADKVDSFKLLPLDAFRAEFMGRQWGVPAEFLCYGKPFSFKQAWSFTLLHDVPVRPHGSETRRELAIASSIWKAMEDFGRKRAEWLPYWNNSQYVETSPRSVLASIYRHRGKSLLAVVSNFGAKSVKANVRFDLNRLGLPDGRLTARDALTGEAIPLRNGRVVCTLPKLGFQLVRIE